MTTGLINGYPEFPEPIMKVCNKCNEAKEFGMFSRCKSSKDGLQSTCKVCTAKYYKEHKEDRLAYLQANKEAIALQRAEYYKANKEVLLAKQTEYTQNNKVALALYRAEYLANHREDAIARSAEYYATNREAILTKMAIYGKTPKGRASSKNKSHKRRALTKGGSVTTEQLEALATSSPNCYYCNCTITDDNRHIDHFIPLSKGGLHDLQNLVIACIQCNLTKYNKMPEVFIETLAEEDKNRILEHLNSLGGTQ